MEMTSLSPRMDLEKGTARRENASDTQGVTSEVEAPFFGSGQCFRDLGRRKRTMISSQGWENCQDDTCYVFISTGMPGVVQPCDRDGGSAWS